MENNDILSRRTLLQGATLVGATAIIGGAYGKQAAHAEEKTSSGNAERVQYGFLINTSHCIGCGKCVQACRRASQTPAGARARRKVVSYTSDFGKKISISTSCMHCERPSCMTVCPAGAISKGDGGIVTVNQDLCIGCKYCFQACPFEVPSYNSKGMDKCDCCLENGVALGDKPKCVEACMFGALKYGVVDELEEKAHGTAKLIEAPTGPSCLLA